MAYYLINLELHRTNLYNGIVEIDKAYQAGKFAFADAACRKVLSDYTNEPASDATLKHFTRGDVLFRMALVLVAENKLVDSLPYFQQSLDWHLAHFQFRKTHRFGTWRDHEVGYNSYVAANRISQIVLDYSRVLVHLNREKEAEKMFDATWFQLLSYCTRTNEPMVASRNAIEKLYKYHADDNSENAQPDVTRKLSELSRGKDNEVGVFDYTDLFRKICLCKQRQLILDTSIF